MVIKRFRVIRGIGIPIHGYPPLIPRRPAIPKAIIRDGGATRPSSGLDECQQILVEPVFVGIGDAVGRSRVNDELCPFDEFR